MSNWTDLKRLEARVDVLENEVAELKARKQRRPPPEVMRGDWIPLTEVDMREGEAKVPLPIAIKFPDGSEQKIRGWKSMLLAVAGFKGVEDWMKTALEKTAMTRHGGYQTTLEVAGEDAAQYAIAFPLNSQ